MRKCAPGNPLRLELKHGVKVGGIAPEMVLAAVVAACVFEDAGVDCVITSCKDGAHSPKSLHYDGKALDFRTRDLDSPELRKEAARSIATALGPEFDVVDEIDHIHVEHDPA